MIYNKYHALTKIHKDLTNDADEMRKKLSSFKQAREDCDLARASLHCKNKELEKTQSDFACLKGRLQISEERSKELEERLRQMELRALKAESALEEERASNREREVRRMVDDVEIFDVHIPVGQDLNINDKILAYGNDDEDTECYGFDDPATRCLHIRLTRRHNNIELRPKRVKRRASSLVREPERQRPRNE